MFKIVNRYLNSLTKPNCETKCPLFQYLGYKNDTKALTNHVIVLANALDAVSTKSIFISLMFIHKILKTDSSN